MPALSEHQSAAVTKLLLVGDSGAGKSGSLASLAAAGYNLRILDLDNSLDILLNVLQDPKSPYPKEAITRVQFKTITEQMRIVGGKAVPKTATVWPRAVNMLAEWKDGDTNLGPVQSWGSQDVLVIDSLTMLSTAALNYHLSLNGRLLTGAGGNQLRRDIGMAQQMIENLLQLLYDTSLQCNVIVISHIVYIEEQGMAASLPMTSDSDGGPSGPQIGYPSALGKALSPKIPRYFNSMLHVKTVGVGAATKHQIFTTSQGVVATKTSAPFRVARQYPIETGLADYFKAVRQSPSTPSTSQEPVAA